jgi:hypothetical protein
MEPTESQYLIVNALVNIRVTRQRNIRFRARRMVHRNPKYCFTYCYNFT